jgi:hypothetical protein
MRILYILPQIVFCACHHICYLHQEAIFSPDIELFICVLICLFVVSERSI